MKFGKTYKDLLHDPAFPEEWREKAINYSQVSKIDSPSQAMCIEAIRFDS